MPFARVALRRIAQEAQRREHALARSLRVT
jgi:hypothetical protein